MYEAGSFNWNKKQQRQQAWKETIMSPFEKLKDNVYHSMKKASPRGEYTSFRNNEGRNFGKEIAARDAMAI